jgi:glycosyltransferase involved in cell wall biosynthesis
LYFRNDCMENKSYIFIVGSYAPSLINFRMNLILALKQSGYSIIAIAPDGHPQVESQLSAHGVEFLLLPLARTGANPFHDWRAFRWLRRMVRLYRPAWVITYTAKPVIYGTWAASSCSGVKTLALITGLGYVAMPPSSKKQRLIQWLMLQLYRQSLKKLTIAAFQNKEDLEFMALHELLHHSTTRIITAGSGVDLTLYRPAPAVTSPIRFLLIARLIKSKGLEQYFEAAEALKHEYKDAVSFQLIGMKDVDNPDAIDEARLLALHNTGVIEFLGQQSDVRPYLAECSVFVLPSFYREGTPRTILEALAMAKPVVTTDNVGCRETVSDGENGFLVPVKDAKALASALRKFVDSPSLINQMGQASLAMARERYDVNLVNGQLMNAMGISTSDENSFSK